MTRIRCIAPALRIASGVLLLVSTAAAQETSPLLSKKLSPAAEAAIRERVDAVHANFRQKHGRDPSYFGLVCCQILQIPAAAFGTTNSSYGHYVDLYGYAHSDTIQASFWAPVQLPTGASIEFLDLYYYDTDGDPTFSTVQANLIEMTGGGVLSGPPGLASIGVASSAGLPEGYGYAASGAIGYTVDNNVGYDSDAAQLYALVTLGSAGLDNQFKAVDIWWMRQVRPAPPQATFGDVPTNHPQFQFVEALASSEITVGCGGGNYCPQDPLTRGQMAVFLAKALGLYWPF